MSSARRMALPPQAGKLGLFALVILAGCFSIAVHFSFHANQPVPSPAAVRKLHPSQHTHLQTKVEALTLRLEELSQAAHTHTQEPDSNFHSPVRGSHTQLVGRSSGEPQSDLIHDLHAIPEHGTAADRTEDNDDVEHVEPRSAETGVPQEEMHRPECNQASPVTIQHPGKEFKHKTGWRTQCPLAVQEKELRKIPQSHVVDTLGANTEQTPFPTLDQLPAYAREMAEAGRRGHGALEALFDESRRAFLETELARFKECRVVVATVNFGAQDISHQPLNVPPASYDHVCFVAFVDQATLQHFGLQACEGSWSTVDYGTTRMKDPRQKARLVKALLPFHFPHADYTIWVDSKLQLHQDPLQLVGKHLLQTGAAVAVSENHVRGDVFAEADKLVGMFHSALSVNKTYDTARERWLRATIARYKADGFDGSGLPDSGLFLRRADPKGLEFSLHWADELYTSPFGRDQISFPYVAWKLGRRHVNLFRKCWYVNGVNEVGHYQRSGKHT